MSVHIFKSAEKYLALDVASGAIHEINKKVAKYIVLLNEGLSLQELRDIKVKTTEDEEIISEIEYLIKNGLLFSKEIVTKYYPRLEDTVTKALCLHIAHDCNMRCSYCFAETGEYKVGKREFMSNEVAFNAIDYLIKSSEGRHNLEVDFFGGEPLLNFDTVMKTVDYANEQQVKHDKSIRFTLTTNGILLDDKKIDYIINNDIQLILSHDGRSESHNRMRPLMGGQDSYEKVTKNFVNAINKGISDYHIRGTFTKYNKDFTKDVEHLLNLGFDKISFEPVVASPEEDYALTDSDLSEIRQEYDNLANLYARKHKEGTPFKFFHYEIDLEQGPCLAKRLTGCGAGYDYLAVAPNGDLYPCHQFVGIADFKMGSVFEEGYDISIAEQFIDAHILNKDECKECFAKFYCSGGCHADAYFRNKDFYKPNRFSCELSKKRVESALGIKADLYEG